MRGGRAEGLSREGPTRRGPRGRGPSQGGSESGTSMQGGPSRGVLSRREGGQPFRTENEHTWTTCLSRTKYKKKSRTEVAETRSG